MSEQKINLNLPKVFNTRQRWFENIMLAKAIEILMKDEKEKELK